MITAQYSIDLHKPVMAIPGRITQPQAMGCLQLIQDGAFMVTKPEHCQEILQSYDPIHTQDN
jgi:DNA processing protein